MIRYIINKHIKLSPYKHSEQELSEFEANWNIKLPSHYRNYLISVGGSSLCDSKVILLEDWDYAPEMLPAWHLSRDFPHSKAWNDTLLHDKKLKWFSKYFSSEHKCGSIPIFDTGCEGRDILVISGTERGNIWHDDRACNGNGIFPLKTITNNRITFQQYITLNRCNLNYYPI